MSWRGWWRRSATTSRFDSPLAFQDVRQSADAIPAIRVRVERQPVHAALAAAVIVGEKVDQRVGAGVDAYRLRLGGEVVRDDHARAAPVVAGHEHVRVARGNDRPVAPADLRAFLAHADDALG